MKYSQSYFYKNETDFFTNLHCHLFSQNFFKVKVFIPQLNVKITEWHKISQ